MQQVVKNIAPFLRGGEVGQQTKPFDADGAELGNCRIDHQHEKICRLQLVGFPCRFLNDFNRTYDCLNAAYEQFMPNAINVILVQWLFVRNPRLSIVSLLCIGTGYDVARRYGGTRGADEARVLVRTETPRVPIGRLVPVPSEP